jgi:hypothetical protein
MAEEKEEKEQEQEWEGEQPYYLTHWPWQGEGWLLFYVAVDEIENKLDVSRGLAERSLRELCGKGDVRSVRFEDTEFEEDADEPEVIRPSEWFGKELDLEVKWPQGIAVSQDDVGYWIDKQPNKRTQPKPTRPQTLHDLIAQQVQPDPQIKEQDPPIKGRVSRKRSLVSKAISTLWEGGIPGTVSNPVLIQHVGNWLTDYCKRENSPKPEISPDTILRAAGRK